MAADQVESVQPDGAEVEEVVADKGYADGARRDRRTRGDRGRRLQRRRGELVERPFAHQYETGGLRRVWVRGRRAATSGCCGLIGLWGASDGRLAHRQAA